MICRNKGFKQFNLKVCKSLDQFLKESNSCTFDIVLGMIFKKIYKNNECDVNIFWSAAMSI